MMILSADPPMPADRTMAPARHFSVSAVQEMMNDMKNSNRCKQDQYCYPDDDTDLHGTHLSVNVSQSMYMLHPGKLFICKGHLFFRLSGYLRFALFPQHQNIQNIPYRTKDPAQQDIDIKLP